MGYYVPAQPVELIVGTYHYQYNYITSSIIDYFLSFFLLFAGIKSLNFKID